MTNANFWLRLLGLLMFDRGFDPVLCLPVLCFLVPGLDTPRCFDSSVLKLLAVQILLQNVCRRTTNA